MTCMSDSSQAPHGESSASDPVAAIQAAVDALRGGRGRRPGPGGRFGPDDPPAHHHGDHGGFGPHGSHGGFGARRGFGGPPGFGLGPLGGRAAFRLLAVLAANGPKSISELADMIGVDQPRASRLARAAIAANHVRREADPADARRSILVITDAGRSVLTDAHDRHRALVEAALADFTEAERGEFASLLGRFVEAWRHPEPDAPPRRE